MEATGETYRARKARRTTCPLCDVGMQTRSLPGHYRSQHPAAPLPPPPLHHDLNTATDHHFLLSAPDKHADSQCPVPECAVTIQGGWYPMRRHFLFRHNTNHITIAEEGELPVCPECGFQCPQPQTAHLNSELCKAGWRRNTRRVLTQAILHVRDQANPLRAGNTALTSIQSFKYLGQWMSADDSDAMAITQNILKARI